MGRAFVIAAVALALAGPGASAAAESDPSFRGRSQLQLDLGLGVVGVGYEWGLGRADAIQAEVQGFSTYFAPLFSVGTTVNGGGAQVRYTRFLPDGMYLSGFARFHGVRGEADGAVGYGVGFSAGAFVGEVFRLSRSVELRVGLGGQFLRYRVHTDVGRVGLTTPFIGVDLGLGWVR